MMKLKSTHLFLIGLLLFVIVIAFFYLIRYGRDVYAVDDARTDAPSDCPGEVRFAVIGDYGDAGEPEADVAKLVNGWPVDYIVTVGDNNYPEGSAETIDQNIGQFYSNFISPYMGTYGSGADENRFWPALGNHDLELDAGQAYFDYFELPGNERYYDVQQELVHLFVLNSDPGEPDGRTADSVQAQWLRTRLANSDATWKLVFMHHTPYTSSLRRASNPELQWPFAEWGATAVLAGHDHFYERLEADGIPYFINGAGGKQLYKIGPPEPESRARYNVDYGAMQVQVEESCLNFSFYNRADELIDSITLWK